MSFLSSALCLRFHQRIVLIIFSFLILEMLFQWFHKIRMVASEGTLCLSLKHFYKAKITLKLKGYFKTNPPEEFQMS